MAGCGGGGGSNSSGSNSSGAGSPSSGSLQLGSADAGDAAIASGSLQQRAVVLRNTSSTDAKDLRVTVAPDAEVLQLPLSCAAGSTAVCQVDGNGTLLIDRLPAGASLNLVQQLRVKPGYSGPISNAWAVSSADASLAVQWQQAMQSSVADLGVALQSVTVSGTGAARTLSYAISLSNAGPDAAQNIAWSQTPGNDMSLQGAQCSASGGAVCPANLGASITIAQVPKGGRLDLVLTYSGYSDPDLVDTEFLFIEARVAGDPNAANDTLMVRQANAPVISDRNGVYDLIDYAGHTGRVVYSALNNGHDLRITSGANAWLAGFSVDVTGFGHIKFSGATPLAWYGDGTLQFTGTTFDHPQGLVTGSFDFGQGLQPFLVARNWITDLSELEGLSYTLLGSRVDATGKPVDAYAQAAKFSGGALLVCASDTPMVVDACPSAQLHRYDAALVGATLELISSTEVLHLRAVRSVAGPVLLRSERASDDSSATVWIGVPSSTATSPATPFTSIAGMPPATFDSGSGLALPTSFGFNVDSAGQVSFAGGGLSNDDLLQLMANGSGGAPACQISGSAQATALPGLSAGNVVGTVLVPSSGAGAPCYQGPAYFAWTSETAVLLGSKDGALIGRWLVMTQ